MKMVTADKFPVLYTLNFLTGMSAPSLYLMYTAFSHN